MAKKNQAIGTQGATDAGKTTTLKVVREETNSTTNSATEPKDDEPKVKSVKDIQDKNNRLTKCFQQLGALDDAAKRLDSFNFGTSRIKDVLEITDGDGNSFDTSNVFLIEKVVTTLKTAIEEKTTEIESEVLLLEAA